MKQIKKKHAAYFVVKLYGKLKSFILWASTHSEESMCFPKMEYCKRFLDLFGIQNCSLVSTLLSSKVQLFPQFAHEVLLKPVAHHNYRAMRQGK